MEKTLAQRSQPKNMSPVESASAALPLAVADEPPPREPTPHFCVAGIGASAGGLEAICELFEAMPTDGNIAFVVVQHLYPTQKSLAAEIISKHTAIVTTPAEDGMLLEPNHIYTIPPNTYPSLSLGRLQLEQPKNETGPRLPIDHFFSSLGNDQKERAIGIILSGSGTDGSLGLKQIEANGGIVMAQKPETAQFDSMPRSAIGTCLVHCILPVAEMPAALVRYAHHHYALKPVDTRTQHPEGEGLGVILNILQHRIGYNFSGYKSDSLIRRIQRRMGLSSINTLADYAVLLNEEPSEIDAMFRDLLIGVTEFFRDPEAWRKLVPTVIKPLVEAKKSGETIRIWVPGCSTGEEAYTVAILLLEQLREAEKRCPLIVFGTDTNEVSLQIGRLGSYPSGITKQVPTEYLHRYFVENIRDHHYQVNKTLRETVVFGNQNLMSDPPFSRVDLICCRNLLIYLESEIQRKIISLFRFALLPKGCLFLGSAENIGKLTEAFSPISKKWRIFQHTGEYLPGDVQLPIHRSRKPHITLEPPPLTPAKSRPLPSQLARLTQQLLLEQFSPAAVLTNARFETLYYSGSTENYLHMPRGTPTHDLLAQVRDGLRSRLRSVLRQASMSGTKAIVEGARVRRTKGFQPVRLSVIPTQSLGDQTTLFMVVFEDMVLPSKNDLVDHESVLVRQLEEELRATKDDLQDTVERLESSIEELNLSNEEVLSINEELQATNEELESSKEELQSLNEELTTVNQQLQLKIADLESSNSDISNLLSSSQIATICLDRNYRIKWFSPSMKSIGNIIVGDVGRPITDFSTAGLGTNIVDDASRVLKTLAPLQRELLSPDNHWHLRRIVPYRSEDDTICGVVITYMDITEAKQTAQTAADAQRIMSATLEDRVRDRTAQLRKLTAELALTEERERRVLARDLHDDLGQVLAIVKIKLTSMKDSERRGTLKGTLKSIEELIDQANRSVRSLMLQLYPPTLQTLGLVAALEWLGEEMERLYGLAVCINDEGDLPALAEPVRTTIFRAIREMLINVAKHAQTNVALIDCLKTSDNRIAISVTDQGLGFDYQNALSNPATDSGFGLISIRERIEFIGGEMTVDSTPGYGTTITIVFPVTAD